MHPRLVRTHVSRHVASRSGQYDRSGILCVCWRRAERIEKYELDIDGLSVDSGVITVR